MINKSVLTGIIEEELKNSDKFLVDILIKKDNKIFVFIDSDTNLTIQDCVDMTRAIESKLDRDKEDFELMVSSPGLDHPLTLNRQFVKNTGRELKIKMKDGNIYTGILEEVTDDHLVIKETKKKKKNKVSGDTVHQITLDNIDEAKVQVSFK